MILARVILTVATWPVRAAGEIHRRYAALPAMQAQAAESVRRCLETDGYGSQTLP